MLEEDFVSSKRRSAVERNASIFLGGEGIVFAVVGEKQTLLKKILCCITFWCCVWYVRQHRRARFCLLDEAVPRVSEIRWEIR